MGAVETALTGDVSAIEELRIGLESSSSSLWGIVVLGLMLSVLVYFSPCAFPVLPGFISYYLSLGAMRGGVARIRCHLPANAQCPRHRRSLRIGDVDFLPPHRGGRRGHG